MDDILFKKVSDVLRYVYKPSNPCDITDKGIAALLDKWADAKEHIRTTFLDGNLIKDCGEVKFTLSHKAKLDKFTDFTWLVGDVYGSSRLSNFLFDNGVDAFYENKVILSDLTPYFSKEKIEDIKKHIRVGSKLVKSFKYFDFDNEKCLTEAQNEASKIIEQNVVAGKLFLSIHPLDYLSISENTCNWRSCHSLDGEYRSGNLSYMCDKSTVVCYVATHFEEHLPHFPDTVLWNSKKWRALIAFSLDNSLVFMSRNYPFSTDSVYPILVQELEKAGYNCSNFSDNYIDHFSGIEFENKFLPIGYPAKIKSLNDIVSYHPDALNYNDITVPHNRIKFAYLSKSPSIIPPFAPWAATKEDTHVQFGTAVPCLHCGEANVISTYDCFCRDCERTYGILDDENFGYCSECSIHLDYDADKAIWIHDGEICLCQNCAKDLCDVCEDCNKYFYTEELIYPEDDEEIKRVICPDCYEDRKNKIHFKGEKSLWL